MKKLVESFLDPFLVKYLPTIAEKRQASRLRMQCNAMAASWSGASTTSPGLSNFFPGVSDIDSSMLYELGEMRNRSHDHVRNVPIAGGLINRICDHSIGEKGLMLHPKIDTNSLGLPPESGIEWQEKVSARWRLFAESKESDHLRRININKKGYLTLQSQLEGGDCFTLFLDYDRPGSPFTFKTQTIEAELVSNPNNESNSRFLYDGIAKDSNLIPEKIWISDVHPGNSQYLYPTEWTARNFYSANGNPLVLQHYNQIRPNQSRGVPILGTVTGKLLNLNKYSDATLVKAIIESYLTVIIKGDKQDTQPNFKSPDAINKSHKVSDKYELGSGNFIRLEKEAELEVVGSKNPSPLFSPYFEAMVAEIGAACGVPRSLIMMMFDKSYSASRGEVILAWMTFLKYRTMIATGYYQPIYERFLDLEIANGNIPAPGYFENPMIKKAYRGSAYHQWSGPVREAINEMNAANANKLYNELGVKSKKQITEEISSADWETVNTQIQHEESLRIGAGIPEEEI